MTEIFSILFPGMMYFWIFFIGQGPMQEILDEQRTHTMQRILAAPVSFNQFLISKMLGCFVLCGIIQALLILASALLFGIKWGNVFLLGLVIAACALSITGVLALIYTLPRTKEQANAISSLILLVLAMIGGSMFPYDSLPAFLQAVGRFSPNRWGILAIQGVIQHKPFASLITPLIVLGIIGLAGSGLAFFLFQRRGMGGEAR